MLGHCAQQFFRAVVSINALSFPACEYEKKCIWVEKFFHLSNITLIKAEVMIKFLQPSHTSLVNATNSIIFKGESTSLASHT